MEKIARGNITSDQRKELVDFIKLHPELNSGKFTNEFTFKKAQELWQTLASNLNALPGANKDWKKWRKTWHDIKTRTKSKNNMMKQHRNKTGGGPPIDINITSEEEEVLGIMGQVVLDDHPGIPESLVEFDEITMLPDQIDHDYSTGISPKDKDGNEIHTEYSNIADENDPQNLESKRESSGKTRLKRPRRVQRLEQTISATAQLATQTKRDISLRENYYTKKNELYEQDITAKLRIASALERIAKSKEDKLN